MKCVIIASGDLEYTDDVIRLIKESPLIICADGGARHLRMLNILPHVLMGDFDSILPEDKRFFEKNQVRLLAFPSKKDHTDSELCVSWALDNHATDITLLGVTGTRLDHTLANIFLLKKLAQQNIPARIINKNNEIHVVVDHLVLNGFPGDVVSVIPITETATGVTLAGLEYPLVNATMEMGSSLGVSNLFKENCAAVSVKKGILIVTKSKD